MVGHAARMNKNRWTKRITDWLLYNDKSSKKRPGARQRFKLKICRLKLATNSTQQAAMKALFTGEQVKAAADDDDDDDAPADDPWNSRFKEIYRQEKRRQETV